MKITATMKIPWNPREFPMNSPITNHHATVFPPHRLRLHTRRLHELEVGKFDDLIGGSNWGLGGSSKILNGPMWKKYDVWWTIFFGGYLGTLCEERKTHFGSTGSKHFLRSGTSFTVEFPPPHANTIEIGVYLRTFSARLHETGSVVAPQQVVSKWSFQWFCLDWENQCKPENPKRYSWSSNGSRMQSGQGYSQLIQLI